MDIRTILEDEGITQVDLSRRLNIPLRTVQGWALGERKPPEYVPEMIYFCIKNGADFKGETVVNR